MFCQQSILITTFLFFCITIVQGQVSFRKDVTPVVITYDQNCMKKYKYTADEGYITETNYTNIHVPLSADKVLILKTYDNKSPITDVSLQRFETITCYNAEEIEYDFVSRVNTKATDLYFLEKQGSNETLYQVDMIFLKEETKTQLNYFAYPFMSFEYDLKKEHYPTEELFPLVYEGNTFETRTYYHGVGTEQGHTRHEFLRMYRDACARRPIAVLTPLSPVGTVNPAKELQSVVSTGPIYRSCQHPIVLEYIPDVGIIREAYQEDGKFYRSRLETIDGMPVAQYLALFRPGEPTPQTKPKTTISQPTKSDLENMIFATKGTGNTNQFREPENRPVATQPVNIGSGTATGTTTVENRRVHVVEEGDTLYSLARKYKTSVANIQKLNNLKSNNIKVEQQLIIK